MNKRTFKYLVGDFETTVYANQDKTEVWASAIVELYTEDVKIFHSIGETYNYLVSLDDNLVIYYHNLKFDGYFWLDYLLKRADLKQAIHKVGKNEFEIGFHKEKEMLNNSFKYTISSMGQWYNIVIKINDKIIEIRDSLKLLPFSVKKIGNSFETKHKKLEMQYVGYRYAGCKITDKEKEYIANDVLVVKEGLEIMFDEGHNKLTIGSCCLSEYKNIIGNYDWKVFFPNLTKIELDNKIYGSKNADEYIRKSYKGGWCYLVKGKENKVYNEGITADVNSLYPSMMSSESGNAYPVGCPIFWTGNKIPKEAIEDKKGNKRYFFVRFRTKFYLKEGKLPFIQIKANHLYKSTECLETSDIYDPCKNSYYDKYYDLEGNLKDAVVELTLTCTDYYLFLEHYNTKDFEILDGCYFRTETGLFDEYIEKYKKIKTTTKGAKRELAKLFLNNLYGKLATSTNNSFKYAMLKDNTVTFTTVVSFDKKPVYIACGSAITSYARNFTIRSAQANYHGKNEKGFIYADTDSIHCDLQPNEIEGIPIDDKKFCHWKLESYWDKAIFVRQKTYIERVIKESENNELKEIEPILNVKCAGMPQYCKDLLIKSMEGNAVLNECKNENEQKFLFDNNNERIIRNFTDFKVGLKIHGKLLPHKMEGGIVLKETTFEMR